MFGWGERKAQVFHDAEKLAMLRLCRTQGIGAITFHKLMARFGSAEKALQALPDFAGNKKFTPYDAAKAEQEIESVLNQGGTLIYAGDEQYPIPLSVIEDAPPVLTVFGNPELLLNKCVALVGSRNASLNGRKMTALLAAELGAAGYMVVSGLARGIDTAAHEAALNTGTIGVLAGGADVIYPPENKKLYAAMCERGAVISEMPMGMQPLAQHFPKRNRIISGLSAAICVVEANPKSGSLITARMAGEQGRDVFAVPGFPLDPRAEGTNMLIRDGAIITTSADDIISHLASPLSYQRSKVRQAARPPQFAENDDFFAMPDAPVSAPSARIAIRAELGHGAVLVDEIIRACHLKSEVVAAALLEMELDGEVERLPGNRVCLCK